jgi:hypothetical protein
LEVSFDERELLRRAASFDAREHGLIDHRAQVSTALAGGIQSQSADDAGLVAAE